MLPTTPDAALSVVTSNAVLSALLPKLQSTAVAIALPKFRFTSSYQERMRAALQETGLTAPFEGSLCFGGEGGCNGKVTDVIHKTVIDVNEQGVEAAAVTNTVTLSRASSPLGTFGVPVLFLANHPFQFFIYEDEEDLVLFEGQVGNPGAAIETETPNLDIQHASPTFWSDTFQVEPKLPDSKAPLRRYTALFGLAAVAVVSVLLC